MLLRSSEMLLQQLPSTLTIIHSYLLLWEWVPPSLNPLAKGLWSIFNLVIFKKKKTGSCQSVFMFDSNSVCVGLMFPVCTFGFW